MEPGKIFRKEAEERLSSPEELDRLLTVVGSKAWIPLSMLGGLSAAALIWAIFGSIPETVDGVGVLINPGNVKPIQSPAAGQILELMVRAGQHVKADEVIARLNQPDLKQQLEQAEARLDEIKDHNKRQAELDKNRRELELKSMKKQEKLLQDSIGKAQRLMDSYSSRYNEFEEKQRENLKVTREKNEQYEDALRKRLEKVKSVNEGKVKLVPEDVVLSAENAVKESILQLANLNLRTYEMAVKRVETDQTYFQNQRNIDDLELQRQQLEIKEQSLEQELERRDVDRGDSHTDADRRVQRLKLQLEEQSKIKARYTGRILELSVSPGQIVPIGSRVGTIEIDDPSSKLMNLVYFQVKDGKKIKRGDKIRVTPANVQRERDGAIYGTVETISSFPISQEAAANNLGSIEIAKSLLTGGPAIEVEAELTVDETTPSGYAWTSSTGPDLQFSAGTTTTVRVTVDKRAPISYVLPILRTWVFGQKDDFAP
jgi:HlyD family secretion protein